VGAGRCPYYRRSGGVPERPGKNIPPAEAGKREVIAADVLHGRGRVRGRYTGMQTGLITWRLPHGLLAPVVFLACYTPFLEQVFAIHDAAFPLLFPRFRVLGVHRAELTAPRGKPALHPGLPLGVPDVREEITSIPVGALGFLTADIGSQREGAAAPPHPPLRGWTIASVHPNHQYSGFQTRGTPTRRGRAPRSVPVKCSVMESSTWTGVRKPNMGDLRNFWPHPSQALPAPPFLSSSLPPPAHGQGRWPSFTIPASSRRWWRPWSPTDGLTFAAG